MKKVTKTKKSNPNTEKVLILFGDQLTKRVDVDEDRSIDETVQKVLAITGSSLRISPDLLEAQLNGFLKSIGRVFTSLPISFGSFGLDSFELTAEITAEGHIGILGNGGTAAAKGGITFTFKRLP